MPIRVLIVDDEPLARRKIRTFLKDHPDLDLIAECRSGREACQSIVTLAPDLVFLDVRIPDRDGFEVLKCVDRGSLPAVIFTTAYDEYAVKAFEVNALDYLLKPFSRQRFAEAIGRFRNRWKLNQKHERGRFFNWLQITAGPSRGRLIVKSNGRILLIDASSVQCVKAEGDYVRIFTGRQSYLMRERMRLLEARLDPEKFVRIHRSAIVNLEFVSDFRPLPGGDYRVFLKDGSELTMSRTFRKQLSQLTSLLS